MDDFIKTVKAQLYERVSSPLLFSFVLSWLVWNVRVIIVAISDMSPAAKFLFIDTVHNASTKDWWIHNLVGPGVTAAAFIFLYPFPAKWVYIFARSQQKKLKEIQQKIDDETPLTKAEARALREAARISAREYEVESAELLSQISKLKEENALLQQKTEVTPAPLSTNATDGLSFDGKLLFRKILTIIAESPLPVTHNVLVNSIGAKKVLLEHVLDILQRDDFVVKYYSQEENLHVYEATSKGREYLVKMEP